jgi:hypothetical protein
MIVNRIETAEDLEEIVAKQTAAIEALTQLVTAMDLKLRAYMKLVDGHELALEKVGIMKAARDAEDENPGGIVH